MPLPRQRSASVHVWRISLDDWASLTPARLAWLDPGETSRAERFYGQAHAQRWRVAHLALREILADALHQKPAELRFTIGAQGKPALPGTESLAFNLSHSAETAVLAVGGSAALGVDIEHITDAPDLADIASTHFAADECDAIMRLDAADQVEGFYRCWTRKEAVVKALGAGIGYDLHAFSVSVAAEDTQLLRTTPPMPNADRWTLSTIELEGPYVGALAVLNPNALVSVADWTRR